MQVTIKDGKNEERTVALESFEKDVVSFGRHPESDIVLKSGAVSRVHGCFYLENGAWHVKDLDSTNGLRCNNARVDDIIPVYGDLIIISAGEYSDCVRFLFKANNAMQQATPQLNNSGNQQYYYPNYYQQPVQGYTAHLGMNYYNFLIWFALFFVAIILLVQGIGCLKVASVDTSQRYKYQEYMDDDTIAFLDELSDEIGTSSKWEKIEEIKRINLLLGIACVLLALCAIYIRNSLAKFKKGAPRNFSIFMYFWIGLYVIVFLGTVGYDFGAYIRVYGFRMILMFVIIISCICANKAYFDKRKHLFIN